ncbi:MAG: hypothetical protein ACXVDE_02075 [Tumebacillaceae bacterium]
MNKHFKNGYQTRFVRHIESKDAQAWKCTHGCTHGIQLIKQATQEVVLEMCQMEAENIAGLMLEAVDEASREELVQAQHPQDTKRVS